MKYTFVYFEESPWVVGFPLFGFHSMPRCDYRKALAWAKKTLHRANAVPSGKTFIKLDTIGPEVKGADHVTLGVKDYPDWYVNIYFVNLAERAK